MEVILTPGPWQSVVSSAILRQLGVSLEEIGVVILLHSSEEALVEGCKVIHASCGHKVLGLLHMDQLSNEKYRRDHVALLDHLRTARRFWCAGLLGGANDLFGLFIPRAIGIYEDGLLSSSAQFAYGVEWHRLRQSPFSLLKYYAKQSLIHRRIWMRPPLYRRIDTVAMLTEQLYDRTVLPPAARPLKIDEGTLRSLLEADWVPQISFNPSSEADCDNLTHFAGRKCLPPELTVSEDTPRSVASYRDSASSAPTSDFGSNHQSRPKALILGSNFLKVESITAAQEYGSIMEAIEMLEHEYEVWWKPHPRADPSHTEMLALRFPRLQIFPDAYRWVPVEAIASRAGFSLIASPMSSSLVYCRELWGIKTMLTPGFESYFKKFRNQDFNRIYQRLKSQVPQMTGVADQKPL